MSKCILGGDLRTLYFGMFSQKYVAKKNKSLINVSSQARFANKTRIVEWRT